jgi:hypothetical protein
MPDVRGRQFIAMLGGAAGHGRSRRGRKFLSLHLALLDPFALALCDH